MLYFISLIFSISICFAQSFPPDSVWTFGLNDGGDEYFYDAIEVDDGFLLCGEAREWNALAGEALLVKIDFDGILVWARTYPTERHRRFKRVVQDHTQIDIFGEIVGDGGHADGLFFGESNSQGQGLIVSQVGYDDGRPQQAVGLGANFDGNSFQFSFQDTESTSYIGWEIHEFGGYVARDSLAIGGLGFCHGYSSSQDRSVYFGRFVNRDRGIDGFILAGLHPQYELRSFGGIHTDYFKSGARISADSITVLAGASYSYSNGSSDLWLQALNTLSLDSVWSHHYGGLSYEDGVEIVAAEDEGFIIAGNFSSKDINFEQSDFWLLKVDEDGDSLWSVVKGGDDADRCEGMIQTENGFLLFGSSQSFAAPGWDGCAMLLAYVPDIAAIPASLNFGPVTVGDSSTRTLALRNTGSNVLTVTEILGTADYHANFSVPMSVEVGDTLRVPVVFAPQSAGTHVDTLRVISNALSGVNTVRCLGAGTGMAADNAGLFPTEFMLHPPYPNPFNPTTMIAFDVARDVHVELSIFDVQGRKVAALFNGNLSAGTHSRDWTCSTCAGGVYFARLRTSEFEWIQKLVLLK